MRPIGWAAHSSHSLKNRNGLFFGLLEHLVEENKHFSGGKRLFRGKIEAKPTYLDGHPVEAHYSDLHSCRNNVHIYDKLAVLRRCEHLSAVFVPNIGCAFEVLALRIDWTCSDRVCVRLDMEPPLLLIHSLVLLIHSLVQRFW